MARSNSRGLNIQTVAISRGTKKEQLAKDNGAQEYIDHMNAAQLADNAETLDLILDTVSADHDIASLRRLLKKPYKTDTDSDSQMKNFQPKLVLLGACEQTFGAYVASSFFGCKDVCVSLTGTLGNTKEVVQLCAEHNLRLPIEIMVNLIFGCLF